MMMMKDIVSILFDHPLENNPSEFFKIVYNTRSPQMSQYQATHVSMARSTQLCQNDILLARILSWGLEKKIVVRDEIR